MSQRDRLIRSVRELDGVDGCSEAMVLQQQPRWVYPSALVLGLLGVIGVSFVSGGLLTDAVVGGVIGALVAALLLSQTSYFILAKCSDEVVLATSSVWNVSAKSVAARWDSPLQATTTDGLVFKKATIGNETYGFAKKFHPQFTKITS